MAGNSVSKRLTRMKQCRFLPVLLATLLLGSCSGGGGGNRSGNSSTQGTAVIVCDNSFENIIEQEIDVFEYQYPNAHILPYYSTQKAAVDSLMDSKTRLIVIPRDLTSKEKEYLAASKRRFRSKKIAVDALALVVNTDNPVEILSVKEIGDILAGEMTDWNDVEPSDLGQINIVFDDEASRTVQYMRDSLMNGRDFGSNVYAQGSIPGVFKAVQQNKNAIGVIGVSWITTDMSNHEATIEETVEEVTSDDPAQGNAGFDSSVKVLKVRPENSAEAYKPYQQYIYDGRYPLFRQIYMITTGVDGTLAHGFFSFVTGRIGQKIITKTGVLPASMELQVVSLE